MPRVALTVQPVVRAGLTATFSAAETDGNSFSNAKRCLVEIVNGSGGPIIATFVTPVTQDGLAVADRPVTVGAGVRMHIGPFTPDYEQSDGTVHINYDAVTTVTIAVMSLV